MKSPDVPEYAVRVVFPSRGLWSVDAHDDVNGHAYSMGRFFVDGPVALPPAAGDAAAASSFPVWPALGGGLGLLLPAAGAALVLRRRR